MAMITIGIDQSYSGCGISFFRDKEFIKLYCLSKGKDEKNSSFRSRLRDFLTDETNYYLIENDVQVIVERIRLKTKGHISQRYIMSTAALIGTIIDVCNLFSVFVYSVDTRAWKSSIVGTSKAVSNKYGISPEKYPTILYLKRIGLLREIAEPYSGRGRKGVVTVNIKGNKVPCKMNDNKADAYCIGKYGTLPESQKKLVREDF